MIARLLSFRVRAESIVETVISLTVLVLGITASVSLIRISLYGNAVLGERVIAVNLAMEALEALQNIRDTNYLRFASDTDNCWNVLPGVIVDPTACETAEHIADGETYILERNFDDELLAWELTPWSEEGDGLTSLYELSLSTMGGTIQMYAQSGLDGLYPWLDLLDEGHHIRTISIDYQSDDAFLATVTVSWNYRGNDYSVSLSRLIANIY